MMVIAPHKNENERIMDIKNIINEKSVVFLDTASKTQALEVMITHAVDLGYIHDVPIFKSAIDSREALGSTAIGDEIAVPHARIAGIDSFFVIAALVRDGIEWDAPDQKPVKIVFLIGGPASEHQAYLSLLGSILKTIKPEDMKKAFLEAQKAEDIVSILTQ